MFKLIKKWWSSFHRWKYTDCKHYRTCQVCFRLEEKKYAGTFHNEDPYWVVHHVGSAYKPCSDFHRPLPRPVVFV